MQTHINYGCSTGLPSCGSRGGFETWLIEELYRLIGAQDCDRVEEMIRNSPALGNHELEFKDEAAPTTALALVLNRRDLKVATALLRAGVSPNLPISEAQRNVYAQRSQQAARNGGDPDIQNLVPNTHFEALCAATHKEFFTLLLQYGANPNSGIVQICHCGDGEMLEALLNRGADPNCWQRETTPLITSVKSKIQPYEKVLLLLRAASDPNFIGPGGTQSIVYTPLILATRKRDYKTVRALLEAAADVNAKTDGDEGLPNAIFWATYWGELELIKLFISLSKHRLDLSARKYTDETVFDVARNSRSYADLHKPRHIAKLPLPSRPAVVYDKIYEVLEQYRAEHPDLPQGASSVPATGSTTATRGDSTQAAPCLSAASRAGGSSSTRPLRTAGATAAAA